MSRLATAAVLDELERRAKVAELDSYLRQLDTELGPVPEDESRVARAWADGVDAALAGGGRNDARPA